MQLLMKLRFTHLLSQHFCLTCPSPLPPGHSIVSVEVLPEGCPDVLQHRFRLAAGCSGHVLQSREQLEGPRGRRTAAARGRDGGAS